MAMPSVHERFHSAVICLLAAVVSSLALVLQGCGGGGGGGSSSAQCWNLCPIEVKGSHLYDSKTGKQFHAKGIGFPNVGDVVQDWIDVLKRVKSLSKELNTVRIYEPPKCATEFGSTCFEPFMKEADRLGVYVIVPGSGSLWGWFPGTTQACDPSTEAGLQKCYSVGGILGWGRTIVDNFHYPNTLAIVLANEIEQNPEALPVLKAYARDMKLHMGMCNSNADSPSQGQMRQIPLMYAATDEGDATFDEADYLFCDDADVSIDIFGLNNERWVSDAGGKAQYDIIDKAIKERQWPGAYMHSEEGGPYGKPYPEVPSWAQVPVFFNNWTSIDGYVAYTYYGNPLYNMFSDKTANGTELADGKAFFKQIEKVVASPADAEPVAGQTPTCKTSITLKTGLKTALRDYNTIKSYDTGKNTYAANCPQPIQPLIAESAKQESDALTVSV
jgi:hypothetical protein